MVPRVTYWRSRARRRQSASTLRATVRIQAFGVPLRGSNRSAARTTLRKVSAVRSSATSGEGHVEPEVVVDRRPWAWYHSRHSASPSAEGGALGAARAIGGWTRIADVTPIITHGRRGRHSGAGRRDTSRLLSSYVDLGPRLVGLEPFDNHVANVARASASCAPKLVTGAPSRVTCQTGPGSGSASRPSFRTTSYCSPCHDTVNRLRHRFLPGSWSPRVPVEAPRRSGELSH